MKIVIETVNYDPSRAFLLAEDKARDDERCGDAYRLNIRLMAVTYVSCSEKARSAFEWVFEVSW